MTLQRDWRKIRGVCKNHYINFFILFSKECALIIYPDKENVENCLKGEFTNFDIVILKIISEKKLFSLGAKGEEG